MSAENGRLLLNGSPIYFKAVLDQGFWPESVLTPPTDEAIQYDIKMTKEMGFNGGHSQRRAVHQGVDGRGSAGLQPSLGHHLGADQ